MCEKGYSSFSFCPWNKQIFEPNLMKEQKDRNYHGVGCQRNSDHLKQAIIWTCTCCIRRKEKGWKSFHRRQTPAEARSGHFLAKCSWTLKNVLFEKSGRGDFITCRRWPSPKMSSLFLGLILETPLKCLGQKNVIFHLEVLPLYSHNHQLLLFPGRVQLSFPG